MYGTAVTVIRNLIHKFPSLNSNFSWLPSDKEHKKDISTNKKKHEDEESF